MSELHQGDALTEAVDTGPCESDRAFFRHNPRRNFRLRPAWTCEIEDFARHNKNTPELPDGWCWWVLVHQLVYDQVRMRWPIPAPHTYYPDPPENIVQKIWREQLPRKTHKKTREIQHALLRGLAQQKETQHGRPQSRLRTPIGGSRYCDLPVRPG